MKDSEFIELLNLYLDHEISAADAARLEAEVQNNPGRRRVYNDYCRMQKACKLLADEFQNETVVVPDPKVIDLEAARRQARAGNFYVAGAFAAAAACVAIIFVGRSRQHAAGSALPEIAADSARPGIVQPAVMPPAPASTGRAIAQTVSVAPRPEQMPGFVANPLFLSGNAQADAMQRAASEEAAAQFAWMERVQLAPIQRRVSASELTFDKRPTQLRPESRGLQPRQPSVDSEVEWSAYRFQR